MDAIAREMLRVVEVAVMLRVSERTVYRLLATGDLQGVKVRSRVLIPLKEVEAYLKRQQR